MSRTVPRLPEGYTLRAATDEEVANHEASGERELFIYSGFMKTSTELPITGVARELLRLADLAPCQLTPNAYRLIKALEAVFRAVGGQLTIDILVRLYKLAKAPNRAHRFYLTPITNKRYPKVKLISGAPDTEKKWYLTPCILQGPWDAAEEASERIRRAYNAGDTDGCWDVALSDEEENLIAQAFAAAPFAFGTLVTLPAPETDRRLRELYRPLFDDTKGGDTDAEGAKLRAEAKARKAEARKTAGKNSRNRKIER